MAKNELLPFANGEDANVLPTQQWEALTDILENGFQSGVARSEQVNRVLAQGAVASYVLGQLIVDQLNKDATLDKSALYQNLILALQENAKDVCLPLTGGKLVGGVNLNGKGFLEFGSGEVKLTSNTESGIEAYSSNSQYKGVTAIIASDGVTRRQLDVNANGDAKWAGKSLSAMGFPSGKSQAFSIGSSGAMYTAPDDGWFYFWGGTTSGTKQMTASNGNLQVTGFTHSGVANTNIIIPVKKGDAVQLNYSTDADMGCRFVYAEGRSF